MRTFYPFYPTPTPHAVQVVDPEAPSVETIHASVLSQLGFTFANARRPPFTYVRGHGRVGMCGVGSMCGVSVCRQRRVGAGASLCVRGCEKGGRGGASVLSQLGFTFANARRPPFTLACVHALHACV